MLFEFASGDFGKEFYFNPIFVDGMRFTKDEMDMADKITILWRRDRLRLPASATDNKIHIVDSMRADRYVMGDQIIVDNEIMQIASVDPDGTYLGVTRPKPVQHKKSAPIIHIAYQDLTSVTYDSSRGSLVFTSSDTGLLVGIYNMDLIINTGSKKSTSYKSNRGKLGVAILDPNTGARVL